MARHRNGVSGYCLLLSALVFLLTFVTRPSQAQTALNVASLAVTITDGEVTREGSQHSFTFDAVIALQGPNAANAPGIMNRWQLAVTVQNATHTCLASTPLTLTPAQAGVAIGVGGSGMIEGVVTGNLDLSGCLCSSVTELKVTLSSPPTIYTFPSGAPETTRTISCRGLIATSLTTLTTGSLVENADDQTVTLTVTGNSETQGRSIQGGSGYWAAEVFLGKGTLSTYTEIGTRVPATLAPATSNIGWSSGGTLTLTGVSAMLDLNGVGSCEDIQLVCVSLMRNPLSTLMFTIEGGSITSCAPVSCIGVLINQVIPSFNMPTMIRQGEQNDFDITVTIRADASKASLSGSGLWSALAFGNADSNCMNPTQVPATVTLTNMAADYGLDSAGQSVWPMIAVSLNMMGAGCNDAMYLCIEVQKGAAPMPPFSLSFSPSFAKYGAVQMECEGLTVVGGMLTVNPATQLAAFKADHTIQFSAMFDSSPMSGGVSGTNLWDLTVFPAENADGSGSMGPASVVTLQTSQLSTPFPGSGGQLALTGLTAVLHLEADACSTYNYLCSRLSKNAAAVPDFIMSTPTLPSCSALLSCKNVTLTSTTASPSTGASPNGFPLFEGKRNQVIYFDATLDSDITGGSVPSGTDHWQFTVSPGDAVAALTQAQKDSPLTAGTPLTFTRIMATLDLTNERCATLGQVCAEVMRSPDDTLGFQLESGATENTGCFTPTCEGVKITALIINDDVTNFALKEGAQGHLLTFSVTATVDFNFGSVRGTDQLWDVFVYLSMDQQKDLTVSSLASLTGWETQDLIAGTQSTFNNVQVSLNLDSTCERMQFLCIELRKASGQTFKLDAASNVLKTCKPVPACNGVEFTDTSVAIISGGPVIEGIISNSPTVGVSMTFAATSADVVGSDFWNVTIYGSTSDVGSGDRIAEQTSVTSGNPAAASTVNFDPITWNVDMTNLLCSDITHVCVEVVKSSDAPFSLIPMSSTICSPLQCEGIVIVNEDFVLSSSVIYEARDNQELTATVISANAAGNGASIPDGSATNIWDVMLFLNSAPNGNGTTFASASPSNPKQVDRDQGVSVTDPLMFSDYTFPLSTTSLQCGAALYVCLEISESSSASRDHSITFPPSPTCKEITCKGPTFVSAGVTAPTSVLIENEPAHPVVLTFSAVTAPDTAVLQTGADFWILKVFASKMADGSGERYGERNAELTPPQKITPLIADSSVQFVNVDETLDLSGFVCPGVTGYLCAELQRDPASLPPFTIQGSPIPLVACVAVECQGVLINSIALSSLPPAIIERGTAPVTLTATVNVGGADASGTMLWEMSASLLDGSTLLSTVPVDLGQQANNDVINGQPIIFSNVMLPFDLSQLVCPSNGTITLCIDLARAGGSNVNFTVTGATRQCTDVPCKGVVIVQSSATATSGDLKEGRESNPMVLDLTFTSSPTGASISGIGLWSLTVFGNNEENGLGPRMSEAMATLQGNDQSFPLPNGSSVEFNSVMATLDLRPYLVCEEVRWVCAELKKQVSSSVDFSLMSESNAHIACTNLNCQGVQIASTTLSLNTANSMFNEDSGSNALSLAAVTLTSAPGSSFLQQFRNNYFKVLLFGSPVAGTSQTKVAETLLDTSGHFVQLLEGDPVTFSVLPGTLNLTGVFCTDFNYLCVQVSRGDTPPFNFKLEGVPNENSLIGCHPVTCKGLRVTGGTFDVTSDLLEGVQVFNLSVQVTFNTSDTGASVRAGGSNLFRLEAFVASNVTGIPDPKTPNQAVELPSGSESQPVMAGGAIDFVGAIAMLDTTTWTCQAENFICIRLVRDPMASVNYKLEGWVDTGSGAGNVDPTKLLTCQPINCQGVNIEAVAIQTGGQTPSFKERDGETSFTVDVAITAAADAGSVVGTGLWNVTFALNSQANGSGDTFATLSVATLSEDNSNKGVTAGSTTTLNGVTVTMPAVADILCSLASPFYLCVKVEKASGSSPDFTIMAIDWHCVPVTCYPVIINDIQFEVTLPTNILENADNYLHIDLHVSTDVNSADIAGTGLWQSPSFQIRDTANAVTPLNATGNYWTSSRENTALIANQTVDFINIFPVQITPSGVLCENLDELCLTFEKGNSPAPQFDLNFTTPNDVCIPVTCKGVEIVSTVISRIAEGSSVKERSSSVLVVLSTLSVSAGDAASIDGTNLWDVSFYYTPNANGEEDLTIGKGTFAPSPTGRLDAGENLALTDLRNTIDLSNLVCPAGDLWLCARLQRHATPTPLFTLSAKDGDDSVFIGCQSVTCRGVEVEDATVIVQAGELIPVENALSHSVGFLYQAMYSPGGASIMGTGLWQLKVFANRRADGSHHRKAYETLVALTADQTNAPLSEINRVLSFPGRTVTLNLQNTECRQTPYFCVQLLKGVNPSPEFSLHGAPDDSALITCDSLDCNGVKITTFSLTGTGGNILHENEDNQMFSFDVVLTSDPLKEDVMGNDLWEFKAYLNNHEDCLGDAEEVALTNAVIQPGEEDQNLLKGGTINFMVDVPLDYQMKCPPWPQVYLCLEVHVGAGTSRDFTLFGEIVKGVEVQCKGVEVTNTAISEVNSGSRIVESDAEVTFDLNLRISSNADGSSISGTELWSVDIFTSDVESCATVTSQRVTSSLSVSNLNKPLSAGALFLMNNVRATVPLPDALCENINYVCVEWGKGLGASPNFTLVPIPDETALIASRAIECKGLHILSSLLNLRMGEPLISNDPRHPITFDFNFQTDSAGASVIDPVDLFRLQVAATAVPSREGVVASQHQVTVPYSPPSMIDIIAGRMYSIPVEAELNLIGARCADVPYICVTLTKGLNAEPHFTLTPDISDPVLTACTQRLDCRGIRIVSEQLTINSGIPFVEHATSNPVDLTVTLTSDAAGGSATGVNLWSAEVKLSNEDPLAPGTVFRANTSGVLTGANADKDLLKGETIELNVVADLNLDGISCLDVRYLIVVITNPNADPGFTLEWRNGSSVVVTQLFTCTGVSLLPNTLMDNSVSPLRELAATSNVTFSVSVLASATSATVSGTDLWKATVFLSADQNGAGTRQAETEAVLDSTHGAVPIVAGMVSGLDDVTVTLTTANLYCRDMAYLCVEVWHGSAAEPFYNIESPATQSGLRQCVATECNGVQVMSVASTIITNVPLIEQRPNQEVRLELNVTASPTSAGINGDNLWRATVFVTSQADGSGTRRSEREATISASQSGRDLNPDAVLTLENLIATMDFTGIPCTEMRYICVTLGEGAAAQPDFSLTGFPDENSLTDCVETNCISVAIQSSSLTLGSNEVLESDDSAAFMLDASFTPWSNSRSLQADGSWDLYVFASNCSDGCGVESARVKATLTTAQQNQEVQVGTPLTFDGLVATLDLTRMNCADTTHLCVRLAKQDVVPFVLGGYPTDARLVSCVELQCFTKTVDLYSTEVTDRRISVAFSEAFGDFDLYVLRYSPPDGITNSPFSIPRNLQRALDFSQLVPGQLYTIELTLMDGVDTKAGPFVLEERTKPDAVTLQLDSVTSSELTVSWDAASGMFDYYTLTLDPSDNGLPRSPFRVYPNQNRELTYTGLLTARSYNVTIMTVSGGVPSSPSTVLANTEPSRPILISTGRAETTVDLRWFIDRSYIVDHYEVTYDPVGTSTQPLILPSEVDSTTLVDLVPGRFYMISLVAVSNLAGSQVLRSTPATVSIRTRPIAPADITHVPTETSIRIEWPSSVGELDFYSVTFSPSVDLGETKVLKDSPRDLLFQGLEVASEYTVTITTHIENVDENLASVPIQRVFYTLPHTPGPLSIVKVTTTSIEFQWLDAAGPRDGYEVTFVPNEPEFNPQSPFFTTSNSMLLSGIQPHVTVDFEVRTKIGNVLSRPRELRQRTFPTQPGPVRDFEVISFDSDQIRISFKAPESPNGLILAYLVSVQGTKPGEPNDSAFQTITALPNDIQFDEVISPLKAGYTYVLSIQATNTEGSSDPVYLDPITLPIKAPFFSGQQIPFTDFVLQVTSSTITIRIPKSLFSDKNGVVTAYTVVVVEEGANQTAVAILPSYQQIRGRAVWPVYQSAEPFNPFNTARRRRQTVNGDTVDFVVGQEETCPSFGYCNGALKPISQYRVRVRAYTENGQFTDSPWSDAITTKFDPWWFVYALIPFMIIVLIIAFIMCLCTCVAGDKKKKPAKRSQRREKSMEAMSPQANENANNIYGTTSSQERLTPDTPPPKRGPRSRPVEVVKFGQHVRKLSSKLGDNFGKEYEDLNFMGESHAKTVGNLTQNVDKNRYPNIVPFDYNRIRLDKEEDYINASSVMGFNGANEYIASQGPTDTTVNDFWQMIWEQSVPAIAVIGSPVEFGRVKFVQYWPSDSTPITFGNITVNRVSEHEETKNGYIVRDFCLESGSEVRALRQLDFIAWPEHGVPKSSNQMLNFIRAVRSALPHNAGPLLVHCGAGIGRTGVFIALDILTQHLSLDEKYIDVFGTVAKGREERTNMVQTVHQYEFLHRALLDILEGRVTGPNWVLKSKRRTSVDSDQIAADEIGEASL